MTRYQARQFLNSLSQFIGRKPKALLLIVLVSGLWFGYEHFVARPAMSYMSLPKVESGIAASGWSHVLRNEAFMLEYSETLANPLWVTYKVTQQQFKSGKRPSRFQADWRSLRGIKHDDYTGSNYDRGHMAPNYVIASRYGKLAQHETFLMTNITPQTPTLNRRSWQRLEEIISNDFSQWHGDFWVVTGPIFSDKPDRLKNTKIAIPRAFYKILIKPATAESQEIALAFIFPQNAKATANLMSFLTTIDDVEQQTGINFFSKLDDKFEAVLEANKTPEAWRLPEVSNRPSRY